MCKILLSINPEYANKIIDGTKKFEFRTKAAKRKVDKIIVYSTKPIMKVIAEVDVLSLKSGNPDELWKITEHSAGISESYFYKYFENRDIAYAYELGKVTIFEEPKELLEYNCKFAPQSFVYIA